MVLAILVTPTKKQDDMATKNSVKYFWCEENDCANLYRMTPSGKVDFYLACNHAWTYSVDFADTDLTKCKNMKRITKKEAQAYIKSKGGKISH